MPHRFETHARTVTLLTLASRVTGLLRDASLSRVFGAGPLMDAFWFAFLLPNLFRRLFGEGALSAAFLPVYTQLDRDDPAVARRLATLTVGALIILLGGLTILGEIILAVLVATVGTNQQLALKLMIIMLPYMPMVCTVAILGAMLQVHHRFGPGAAAPIILNLCIVAAAVGFSGLSHERHITMVAWAVVLAGMLQVIYALWSLRGSAWWTPRDLRASRDQLVQPMRRVILTAMPMILGMGVLQLNTFLDSLIASYPTVVGPRIFGVDYPLDEGAMASLSFAQRLYEFPLGVFGIAVATAIFPALSRVNDDREAFASTLRRGLRLVMFRGLPASAGLMLVAAPLTAVVYQGRNFSAADTQRVAFILVGYAPAIWAYSMMHVLTRAFYARGDSRTPMKVALAMVALNLLLNLTLIWTPLKEAGLAWSTALCAMVQIVILLALIRREVDHVMTAEVWRGWLKTAIGTVIMSLAVYALARWLIGPAMTWRQSLAALACLVAAGATVFAFVSWLLRMPELRWALGRGDAADPAMTIQIGK
jgi:putative peptidoglycan lipid II flippase